MKWKWSYTESRARGQEKAGVPARPTRGRGDPGNWTSSKVIEDCVRVLQNSGSRHGDRSEQKNCQHGAGREICFRCGELRPPLVHELAVPVLLLLGHQGDRNGTSMSHESQSRPAPGGPCNPRPLSPKRRSSVFSFGFLVLDPGHADAGESFLSAARLFFFPFFAVRYQEQEDLPEALPLRQHREGHAVHRGEDSGVL